MGGPTDRDRREREWLEREVALAARLSDADRIRILEDLWQTVEAIRATKSPEQIEREERVRRELDEPGRARYRALAARLG
jgi:hypothetical protein